jgi:hypothetical protein
MLKALQKKRERSAALGAKSAFAGFPSTWVRDRETLPCLSPRIAFRDISRSTDSRTVRATLIPPNVFLTNKAPYFLWIRGDDRDTAFLLGVLSSLVLDWYSRRFVELSMNYHILNAFPVPRVQQEDALGQRTVMLSGRLAAVLPVFRHWAKSCLRRIRCRHDTVRVMPDDLAAGAHDAWSLAAEHIFQEWMRDTDPANLQPKVRPALFSGRTCVPSGVEPGFLTIA